MICILLTGSRDFADEAHVATVLRGHADRFDGLRRVVVHGDACGLDTIADRLVREFIYGGADLWSVVAMPAQWDRDGKAAGPLRNQRMLDVGLALQACGYELVVEAFPLESSRGTWDMVKRCEKAGVKVNVNKPTEGA